MVYVDDYKRKNSARFVRIICYLDRAKRRSYRVAVSTEVNALVTVLNGGMTADVPDSVEW